MDHKPIERQVESREFKQMDDIPPSVICQACTRPVTDVCAVCLARIHLLGKCGLGRGPNTEYLLKQNEIIGFCFDCAWTWIKLLEAHPDKETAGHKATAIGSTKGAALAISPKKGLATECLEKYSKHDSR